MKINFHTLLTKILPVEDTWQKKREAGKKWWIERRKQRTILRQKTAITAATGIINTARLYSCVARRPSTEDPYQMHEGFRVPELFVIPGRYESQIYDGFICGWNDLINHLKTKRRLFYLKTQSVPRCKHFPPRL